MIQRVLVVVELPPAKSSCKYSTPSTVVREEREKKKSTSLVPSGEFCGSTIYSIKKFQIASFFRLLMGEVWHPHAHSPECIISTTFIEAKPSLLGTRKSTGITAEAMYPACCLDVASNTGVVMLLLIYIATTYTIQSFKDTYSCIRVSKLNQN